MATVWTVSPDANRSARHRRTLDRDRRSSRRCRRASVAVWAVAQIRQAPTVSSGDASAVQYSDDEVLAAKQQICEASELVANAVGNSGAPVNPDDDVALRNANVALSQIAFLAGALIWRIDYIPTLLRNCVRQSRSKFNDICVRLLEVLVVVDRRIRQTLPRLTSRLWR